MAQSERFSEYIHNQFSPYMVLLIPYMVKIGCEYTQETPLATPLDPEIFEGLGGGGGGGTVLPRSGNVLGIVDAYPVSHPVSIIGDAYN